MFIAIDAGTSMVKAVLYDELGSERQSARREAIVSRPQPLWAEQDMNEVWAAVSATVREVGEGRTDIDFISVTAQGDGCWLVDANGRPTGPAILWNDGRASKLVEQWSLEGRIDQGYSINGSITFPGLANAILSWFKTNDPQRLAVSDRALTCLGWLFMNLTGEARAELSDASAPFVAAGSQTYDSRLLDLYGLGDVARLLPPIVSGSRAIGALHPDAARQLGLSEGTAIVMAPYDVAAAAIGVGATTPGQATVVLGTTIFTGVITDKPQASGAPTGSTIALGLPGRYLRFFPSLNGAETLMWAAKVLNVDGPAEVTALAAQAQPGANGVTFLPYLSPAGERAPFLEPFAQGSLWNLSLENNRADIARAVVEGLTAIIVDCLHESGIQARELRLTGGGANSDFWCQLVADATGIPTVRVSGADATARGALIAGWLATGRETTTNHADEDFVDIGQRWEPDASRSSIYKERFEHFRRLRDIARSSWSQPERLAA